jgi:hypothetical protein
MLVLDVLMIVPEVRVSVRHIPVRVLMGVLLHRLPSLSVLFVLNVEASRPWVNESEAFFNRHYTPHEGYLQAFPSRKINAPY